MYNFLQDNARVIITIPGLGVKLDNSYFFCLRAKTEDDAILMAKHELKQEGKPVPPMATGTARLLWKLKEEG